MVVELEKSIAIHRDQVFDFVELHKFEVLFHLLIVSVGLLLLLRRPSAPIAAPASSNQLPVPAKMEAKPVVLDPPKDDPITVEDLAQYNGTDPSKPIYVAIKGTIFDVSAKRDMYGPGKGYNIFAGKDGSKGLGKSSLNPDDAIADWSTLDEKERVVLEDWVKYFTKRYNIVGKVSSPSSKM